MVLEGALFVTGVFFFLVLGDEFLFGRGRRRRKKEQRRWADKMDWSYGWWDRLEGLGKK